jgi:hypothetical protein
VEQVKCNNPKCEVVLSDEVRLNVFCEKISELVARNSYRYYAMIGDLTRDAALEYEGYFNGIPNLESWIEVDDSLNSDKSCTNENHCRCLVRLLRNK